MDYINVNIIKNDNVNWYAINIDNSNCIINLGTFIINFNFTIFISESYIGQFV